MTDDEPLDEAALNDELTALLRRATRDGTDVQGGWTCPNNDGLDWDVVVTEVRSSD